MVPAKTVIPCLRIKVESFIVTGFIASLKDAVNVLSIRTPVVACAGSVEITVGRFVSFPVVKLHTKSCGSAVFALSLTPVVILPVYVVYGIRSDKGVKVAVTPE
jgi:hypothetical protein